MCRATVNDRVSSARWAEGNGPQLREYLNIIHTGSVERLLICKAVRDNARVGDTIAADAVPPGKEIGIRTIPKDFVLPKTSDKYSNKELTARSAKWDRFDLRPEGEGRGTQPSDHDQDKVKKVLDAFRELIYQLGIGVVNTHFANKFKEEYPGFTWKNGRQMNSITDFCDFLHEYDPSKEGAQYNEKDILKMIHFTCYGLWDTSNFWAERGEIMILTLLQLKYDDNRMSDGSVMKRKQRGGFIKALLVKKLDMYRNKVNDSAERVYKVKFFHRNVYKPSKPSSEEDGNSTGKKKKQDKSHLAKYVKVCKKETDGFEGNYLYLEGHAMRRVIDGEETKKTTQDAQEDQKKAICDQFQKAICGNKRALDELKVMAGGLQNCPELTAALQVLQASALMVSGTKCPLASPEPARTGPPPNKRRKGANGTASRLFHGTGGTSVSESSHLTSSDDDSMLLGSDLSLRGSSVQKDAANWTDDLGMDFEKERESAPAVSPPEQPRVVVITKKNPVGFGKQPRYGSLADAAAAAAKALDTAGVPNTPSKAPRTDGTAASPSSNLRNSPIKGWPMPPCECPNKHHNDPNNWTPYESNWYTKTNLKSHPQIPRVCLKCARIFTKKKAPTGEEEKFYRLNDNMCQKVMACAGAMAPGNEFCNRAFCTPCFDLVRPAEKK